MLISRLLPASRLAFRQAINGQKSISTSAKKMSGTPFTYREFTMPDKNIERWAEVVGGIMWWWIFWNCFTNYGHLVGEFEFVYPETWTDEELGIPPDSADDPE